MTAGIEAEIVGLHEWFDAWFSGEAPADSSVMLEAALHEDFAMIGPDGEERDRASTIAGIIAARGSGARRIAIRDVRIVGEWGDTVAVRYEEWQGEPGREQGRVSTAILERDGSRWRWRHVHETRLGGPAPAQGTQRP